ncbi:MAG: hypothetical protein LBH51_01615 [Treponema sp.]|jgi:hypothetical protein|nr:hypothetical protein [Treponema sp.]
MREIWIPEILSSLFTLIFLLRPLFKGLRPLGGIAWFPILAFTTTAALFPAYGFRPEALPLLVYQGALALLSVRPLLAAIRRSGGPRSGRPLFTIAALAGLALFSAAALRFAPLDPAPTESRLIRVEDGGRRYKLQVFAGRGPSRGVIFLAPPDFGGMKAVDGVCAALGDRGFTVIGYTRSGFRSPAALAGLWSAFRGGAVLQRANKAGRGLEEERQREIAFILSFIRENWGALAPGAEEGPLFLAGWGAGGSALYYLTAEGSPPGGRLSSGGRAGDRVSGLVMVESRLWSSWEPAAPPVPQEPGILRRWVVRFQPGKMAGPGNPRPPAIPLLYLASDRALEEKPARQDYAALFASLRNARGPAALAALEGAGPLDYSDFPGEHPLYSALFSGSGAPEGGAGALAGDTAALIARFCALAAGEAGREPEGGVHPAEPEKSRRGLRLETRYWNLGDLGLY